jgi:hypothetical protein
MESPENRWPNTVCARCIEDLDLRRWVRANAAELRCDNCGRSAKHPIAAAFDEFVKHIECCARQEYEDAAEQAPVEGGEYQVRWMTNRELLEMLPTISEDEAILQAVADRLTDCAWVPRALFWPSAFEALRWGWDEFARLIKHETRFLFFSPGKTGARDDGVVPAAIMLEELGALLKEHRRVRRLRKGTLLYRVRAHAAHELLTDISDFTPPPLDLCVYPNRMSPAGIPMFYVAMDPETAIAETLSAEDRSRAVGTLATLELSSDVSVVDFAKLPRCPSIFTPNSWPGDRASLQFLHALSREFSKTVERDDRQHIEYVPTQVVTEYLRYRFRPERPVEGLRYRSARRPGGTNLALFYRWDDFHPDPWFPNSPRAPFRLIATQSVAADSRGG